MLALKLGNLADTTAIDALFQVDASRKRYLAAKCSKSFISKAGADLILFGFLKEQLLEANVRNFSCRSFPQSLTRHSPKDGIDRLKAQASRAERGLTDVLVDAFANLDLNGPDIPQTLQDADDFEGAVNDFRYVMSTQKQSLDEARKSLDDSNNALKTCLQQRLQQVASLRAAVADREELDASEEALRVAATSWIDKLRKQRDGYRELTKYWREQYMSATMPHPGAVMAGTPRLGPGAPQRRRREFEEDY